MKKNLMSTLRNVFDVLMIFLLFIGTTVYALPSNSVTYDNSNSGSPANNVSDAIDDLYTKLNKKDNEISRLNSIGNATKNHILKGYTALVQGKTLTGTILSKGQTTYTPGTSNQTIEAGQYLSGSQTIMGDANLVSDNIIEGKSIFGVKGSIKNNFGKTLEVTNVTNDNDYTYLYIPEKGVYDTSSVIKLENTIMNSSAQKNIRIRLNVEAYHSDYTNPSLGNLYTYASLVITDDAGTVLYNINTTPHLANLGRPALNQDLTI